MLLWFLVVGYSGVENRDQCQAVASSLLNEVVYGQALTFPIKQDTSNLKDEIFDNE